MKPALNPEQHRTGVKGTTGLAAVRDDLFQAAFHNNPAMQSVVRAADGVIVEVNDTFLNKLGLQRSETLGKTAAELDFWVDAEQLAGVRRELEARGALQGREVQLRARSGGLLTVLLSSRRIDIDGVSHFLSAGVDITAGKLAEAQVRETSERLRKSEARFSEVFRTNPALMAITRRRDGVFIAANEAFYRTTGFREDETLGHTAADLNLHVAPGQREEFLRLVATHGSVRDFEFVIRTHDGRLRTLLASADLIDIDDESHVQTVGLDITERKRAEEELRESELRFRESEARFSTAFHASPVLMTIGRLRDETFVEVNDAFVRLLGHTREDILGRDSKELGLWVNAEERAQFYAKLKEARVLRNVECNIRSLDGRTHNMLISGELIEINREPHLITFALDVTQRKQAERDLKESEAKFRSLYDLISSAVIVHDESGILQANPAALKLLGATRQEQLLGKQPYDFAPLAQPNGEDSTSAARRHSNYALTEGTHHFEWVGRTLAGSTVIVEVTLTALHLNGRQVLQAVITDLTERKRAEQELQKSLAKERELNQLKSDFVSLVSHEFRTPLEVIISSADNLERYHERLEADKRIHLLHTIQKAVRRMSYMMEDVLLMGRLESGRMEFNPVTFDLLSFCQRLCDEMETARNHRCPITLTVLGPLAEARGDEGVIRHVLTNLLSNAVKYSDAGQPVELHVTRDIGHACFSVRDHGCGIPAADQARLFQAFHRGSNVRQLPGTGLGLVIVKRSVELHGGDIRFESVEGKGTTFTVRLPMFNR